MKNLFKKLAGGMDESDEFENDSFNDDIYEDYDDVNSFDGDSKNANDNASFTPVEDKPNAKISGDKVSIKLMKPMSHADGTKIADKLLGGSIVVLDISGLVREEIIRLIDYIAGAIHVLGGDMIKTNRTTIVVAPAGVDISGFGMEDAEEDGNGNTDEPATSYIRENGQDY
jgi:FtsZ-interacting cell division protein YlmF